MDDLPNTSGITANQPAAVSSAVGSTAKEVLPPSAPPESPIFSEVGKETELPAEVKRAGVMMRSDSVTLPIPVQKMGVTPVIAQQTAPAAAQTVTLPLSDDQIALGLHQSIVSSWRWLAEWCNRQLKHAHILLKAVGGKVERSSS